MNIINGTSFFRSRLFENVYLYLHFSKILKIEDINVYEMYGITTIFYNSLLLVY